MKLPILIVAAIAIFLSGCPRSYDTYTECKVVEEQKGASPSTASMFCYNLVKKREIKCDHLYCE